MKQIKQILSKASNLIANFLLYKIVSLTCQVLAGNQPGLCNLRRIRLNEKKESF